MSIKLSNSEFASKLRAIADVYDANPGIPQLYNLTAGNEYVFCHAKNEFAAAVKAFGTGEKGDDDDGLKFYPEITEGLTLRVYGFKSAICERVEVGKTVIPATPEVVIPATPEQIVSVYEWHCGAFLDEGAEVSA